MCMRRSGDFSRTFSFATFFDSFRFRLLLTLRGRRSAHAGIASKPWEYDMSLGTILLIVVVLLLVGAIPSWPHSRTWGYGPSGGLGLVLLIIIILVVLGRI